MGVGAGLAPYRAGTCAIESLVPSAVYHAIFLEELTTLELIEKIANLYSISPQHIHRVYRQGPTGIHVVVSNEVSAAGFPAPVRWGSGLLAGAAEAAPQMHPVGVGDDCGLKVAGRFHVHAACHLLSATVAPGRP